MSIKNGFAALTILATTLAARQVTVSTSADLLNATKSAIAGDTILVAPGTYTGDTTLSGDSGHLPNGKGFFWIGNSGTVENPIVLVAQNPANPPILQGTGYGFYVPGTTAPISMTGSTTNAAYVMHVTGNYVYLKNLKIQFANKAVVYDHASFGIIEDCELSNSGAELLHIRDSSSNVTVNRNYIHNSGNLTPNYGEAIYIGTDQARWGAPDVPETSTVAPWWGDKAISEGYGGYDWRVHHTLVTNNFMSDFSAEGFDIKEGTEWTTVQNNVMLGDSIGCKGGVPYYSYVGSFLDQKGVKGTMTGNTFYAGNNAVDPNNASGMTAYCAEVNRSRSYPHVPDSLTTVTFSKPWFDTKLADSNYCAQASNTVATTLPADSRTNSSTTYFNFHTPSYGGTTAITHRVSHLIAQGFVLKFDLLGRLLGVKNN